MRLFRDRGEGAAGYMAVLLVIATITAVVISATAVPEQISAGMKAAVCKVAGGKDCKGVDGAGQPGGQPTGQQTQPAAQQCAADDYKCQAEQADREAAAADQEAADADREARENEGKADLGDLAADFGMEASGLADAKRCFTEGDLAGCGWTAISLVPVVGWFGRGAKAAKAAKKFDKLKDAYDKYKKAAAAARKRADDARERARQARERARQAREKLACKKPNSFLAGTLVVLGDGRLKPIQDVDIGDRVLATDPKTGSTRSRPVTDLISREEAKRLVDVDIATGARSGAVARITATDEHPFWVAERGWVNAEDLARGDRLTAADGDRPAVRGARAYDRFERTYNFTVADLHTYYVVVGGRAVLVHNSRKPIPCLTPEQIDKKIDDALKDPDKNKQAEGNLADALRRGNCRPNQFQQLFDAAGSETNGDIDVGVPGAVIEVYNGTAADMGKKGHQAKKFRNHPDVNPDGKRQVIFFAPNVSELDRKRFQQEYGEYDIRVFASQDHLVNHLRRTGAC
ncbi:polymorphic toxin-type HINT domain-containing protein [Spirillospora sp. NPDC029432]|uniref:polymorphic toxin-type HINT domain-containing protein n=1 Tax=Spirillospora sp. NPDC029432 TaxID=3154599 RepID=UPI00345663E8